ncbi:MAG: S-layer homology domain-containing protein [Candidatus Margulisiibacteriota bacterium]
MRKIYLILTIVIYLAVSSFAAQKPFKFKDVPNNSWAAGPVYDLVKMGITKGYPDGTFRGDKPINRYETAVFMSKLSNAIGGAGLTLEVKALKDDVSELKRKDDAALFYGSCESTMKVGNVFSVGTREAVMSYRLRLTGERKLSEDVNVKINLDTMDYGFDDDGTTTTGGILATELLDIASNVKLNLSSLGLEKPINLSMTYGPGPKQHKADPTGVLPSDVGVTFIRPYTGISASTSLLGMDVSGAYLAPNISRSGRVQQSWITGTLGWNFESVPLVRRLKLETTGDFVSTGMFSNANRNLRASIALAAPLTDKIEAFGKLGMGGSAQKAWMVDGQIKLNDVFDTGTVATIKLAKVGSQFINDRFSALEFDFAGYDRFNRPLENGTVNLGGEISQSVAEGFKLVGKGDLRLAADYKYAAPKGRLTAEGGISYAVAPNASLDALYRVQQDKATHDTSDMAALGLMYQF